MIWRRVPRSTTTSSLQKRGALWWLPGFVSRGTFNRITRAYRREYGAAAERAAALPCSCFILMLAPPESEAEIRGLAGCGCAS